MKRFLFSSLLIVSLSAAANAQFLGQQSLSESSYVIDQSGNLWVWGRNDESQLGLGDRIDRDTPVMVPIPTGATRWTLVAAGPNFTLALADSDKLYAWGLNDRGQIGIGAAGGDYGGPMRIQNPSTVTGWKWVSAGSSHGEALTTDGRLYAWGDNQSGELGVGNTHYFVSPQLVEFPTGVTAWMDVAAGPNYSMMISQSGALYGCGTDSLGLFDASSAPQLARVDTFRAASPLAALAASFRIEMYIDQLYYSPGSFRTFNTSPDGGAPRTTAAVAAGGEHALYLDMSGTLQCGGDNSHGQVGLGHTNARDSGQLAFPFGVSQFVAIAGGLDHSLAIGNDGWLYAWGDNSHGELGIGNTMDKSLPVRVMKACPPIAMTGSLSTPGTYTGPYTSVLNLKNTSSSTTLQHVDASLALAGMLVLDTSMDQELSSNVAPGNSASLSWATSAVQYFFTNDQPPYFAYIRANGSAPLLVYQSISVPGVPAIFHDQVSGMVQDALTGVPIAGAEIDFGNPTPHYSDKNGNYTLSFTIGDSTYALTTGTLPVVAKKENYLSGGFIFSQFPRTLFYADTIYLGPAGVIGLFTKPAESAIDDTLTTVYYPDSLIGYALSRHAIFRTLDSGLVWSDIYNAAVDLHDIKFADPAHGFVVGGKGTVLSTTDSGKTWLTTTALTTQNLRALFMTALDTAWAVGDSGTLLKLEGNSWNTENNLGAYNLSSISFIDPNDGVIGADSAYFTDSSGTWVWHAIATNVQAADYVAPGKIYFAGTNGTLVLYDLAHFIPNPANPLGPWIIDTLIFDSTYSTQTMHSLYFLNRTIGFAVGDRGASFVTYDSGSTWATLSELPNTARAVNFFSLAGHAAMGDTVLNYEGVPNNHSGIVRGRLTFGNPPEPILGATIYKIYVRDTGNNYLDSAYTNDQGNFVFAPIDTFFQYEYAFSFSDSGIRKSVSFPNIRPEPGEIVTLNYNDFPPPAPPPPPPDTNLSVNADAPSTLFLEVNATQSIARIVYTVPASGSARIIVQDVLGHAVREIVNGFIPAGEQSTEIPISDMPSGVYYVTLETGGESITKKFEVVR